MCILKRVLLKDMNYTLPDFNTKCIPIKGLIEKEKKKKERRNKRNDQTMNECMQNTLPVTTLKFIYWSANVSNLHF